MCWIFLQLFYARFSIDVFWLTSVDAILKVRNYWQIPTQQIADFNVINILRLHTTKRNCLTQIKHLHLFDIQIQQSYYNFYFIHNKLRSPKIICFWMKSSRLYKLLVSDWRYAPILACQIEPCKGIDCWTGKEPSNLVILLNIWLILPKQKICSCTCLCGLPSSFLNNNFWVNILYSILYSLLFPQYISQIAEELSLTVLSVIWNSQCSCNFL